MNTGRFIGLAVLVPSILFMAGCGKKVLDEGCGLCKHDAAGASKDGSAGPAAIKMGGKTVFSAGDLDQFVEVIKFQAPQFSMLPEPQLRQAFNQLLETISVSFLALEELKKRGWDKGAEYQRNLKAAMGELERNYAYQEFLRRLYEEVKPTEKDAQEYYLKNQATMPEFQRPPFTDAGVIARAAKAGTQQEAEALLARARASGDLAKAAKEMKKDVRELGAVSMATLGQLKLDYAVASKILSMQTFPSFEIAQGSDKSFWVVQGISRQKGAYAPFEKVREQVMGLVASLKLNEQIKKLREDSKVEINQALIDQVVKREAAAGQAPKPQAAPKK